MTDKSRGKDCEFEPREEISLRRAHDLERVTRMEMRVDILEEEVDIIKKTQSEILNYQREQAANLKTIKYSLIFGIVGYTVSTLGPKGLEFIAKIVLKFV